MRSMMRSILQQKERELWELLKIIWEIGVFLMKLIGWERSEWLLLKCDVIPLLGYLLHIVSVESWRVNIFTSSFWNCGGLFRWTNASDKCNIRSVTTRSNIIRFRCIRKSWQRRWRSSPISVTIWTSICKRRVPIWLYVKGMSWHAYLAFALGSALDRLSYYTWAMELFRLISSR